MFAFCPRRSKFAPAIVITEIFQDIQKERQASNGVVDMHFYANKVVSQYVLIMYDERKQNEQIENR